MKPTVFLVDDDPAFLKSTSRLLTSEKLPVEMFESGRAFLRKYKPEYSGCLLLDLMMPDMSGLDVLARMRKREILLPTIVMTAFGSVQSAVQAMKSGALDFIEKPIHNNQELIRLIRRILTKGSDVQTEQQELRRTKECLDLLTEREREVLDLVVSGFSTKEIARELGLGIATVNSHRVHILEKFEVSSVQPLVRMVCHYRLAQP
jgi:two-component system response regulator FixJ